MGRGEHEHLPGRHPVEAGADPRRRAGSKRSSATTRDFLTTRVSYKLNLRGPSVNVQTACSTSLVAVHEACQGPRSKAAATSRWPAASRSRLRWSAVTCTARGGILSPDGHCRVIRRGRARERSIGNGVGVGGPEAPRARARRRRPHPRGDPRDGGEQRRLRTRSASPRPSVEGQAEVIASSRRRRPAFRAGRRDLHRGPRNGHAASAIRSRSRRCGRSFEARTDRKGYCGIGSLKSNMGHMDAAAGVGGPDEDRCSRSQHGELPPSLHFGEGRTRRSTFERQSVLRRGRTPTTWERPGRTSRGVAGESAFGIGGTNAHVLVEEAPELRRVRRSARATVSSSSSPRRPRRRARRVLRAEACGRTSAASLRDVPAPDLADVAYTLQVGRAAFEHRRAVVCGSARRRSAVARAVRRDRTTRSGHAGHVAPGGRIVRWSFMFPGQGAQYVNMGRGPATAPNPSSETTVDRCIGRPRGARRRSTCARVLYPDGSPRAEVDAAERLTRNGVSPNPRFFTVQYALAHACGSWWGIEPEACIGHSVGELTAACVSGVLELGDALRLVGGPRSKLVAEDARRRDAGDSGRPRSGCGRSSWTAPRDLWLAAR